MMRRRGQLWSGDAVVAVIVVVLALIGLLVYGSGVLRERGKDVMVEENAVLADALGSSVGSSKVPVMRDVLDADRVEALSHMEYYSLKRELGMTSDFCIHFTDANGNMVPVKGVWFLGSPYINVTVTDSGGNTHLFACNGTLWDETTQCNDGIDNVPPDGLIDYPADPECTSVLDNSE